MQDDVSIQLEALDILSDMLGRLVTEYGLQRRTKTVVLNRIIAKNTICIG